ncbi:major capsid protein [Kitasatospora sp. McL0602]|uniref:major capsid protein n=1 Tax=Kitasatospora sp. McL0602 TaxID=3439530 RepID=UPI003F8C8A23
MPQTLAQAAVNTLPDIDFAVIDNLRRYSWLLDQMVFDDSVTPGVGGGTLTYGYTRLTQARPAQFRKFNEEYPAAAAQRQRFTVDLKPLGGSFNIDRSLARLGAAASNEIAFQTQQLLTSVRTRFQEQVISGDSSVDDGCDGLDKMLTGQSTEYLPINNGVSTGYLDWTPGTISSQALAMAQLDILDSWLSTIVPSHTGGGDAGAPGALPPGVKAICGNTQSITRVRALARWAAMYTATQDDLGRKIEMYGQWVLVDLGDKSTGAGPIVPIQSRDPDGAGAGGIISGLTDLYAVSFGLDALHGASAAGQPLVTSYMPNFELPGAVKTGEVEMGPIAVVLRNTRSAGVLRNLKVG